jgi:hypothetical protein
MYRAAAIVKERLLRESSFQEGLRGLRILRHFLKIVGERWLGCGELSKVPERLNELTEHM